MAVTSKLPFVQTEKESKLFHFFLFHICRHPTDQKLMSGVDMFKHASALLTHCMQIADSKVLILGMKCLRHLFRLEN